MLPVRRLMIGYLNRVGGYSLKKHTVYTTLEPCAQCSGMMTLCSIERTVYGQTDPGFGKAMERLALDSKKWNLADQYQGVVKQQFMPLSGLPGPQCRSHCG